MRVVRWLVVVVAALSCAFGLVGCASPGDGATQKLTVHLWSADLLPDYVPYVESQVPDVDIEWVMGANDLSFYEQLGRQGQMPDIVTNRRFSLGDAEPLTGYLLDIGKTEVAASYYGTHLDAYRNDDGSVNWLPACGEVDGFLANKALFDEAGVPLPVDRDGFAAACRAFEERGIKGFMSDFAYDYTCTEVLQGASIPQLVSLDGKTWRLGYESGRVAGLDDEVWPSVFENMDRFIEDARLTPADAEATYHDWFDGFADGRIAIVRGTGVDVAAFERLGMDDVVFLPYFGETPDDSWVMTYPSFNIALSAQLEDDPERRAAALRVLDVMLSSEAQNILSHAHSTVSYSKNVTLETSEALALLEPAIEANHLYIRVASNEFFDASHAVVRKMIDGTCTASQAYAAFDAALRVGESNPPVVATLAVDVPCSFDPAVGNPASSALANTLRAIEGSDLLLSPMPLATAPLKSMGYTEQQLGFLVAPNASRLYTCDLTGEEVVAMVRGAIEESTPPLAPGEESLLPVASGFSMRLSRDGDGFAVEAVEIDGEPINPGKTYRFTLAANITLANLMATGDSAVRMGPEWVENELPARVLWARHLMEGARPEAPTPYVSVEA